MAFRAVRMELVAKEDGLRTASAHGQPDWATAVHGKPARADDSQFCNWQRPNAAQTFPSALPTSPTAPRTFLARHAFRRMALAWTRQAPHGAAMGLPGDRR